MWEHELGFPSSLRGLNPYRQDTAVMSMQYFIRKRFYSPSITDRIPCIKGRKSLQSGDNDVSKSYLVEWQVSSGVFHQDAVPTAEHQKYLLLSSLTTYSTVTKEQLKKWIQTGLTSISTPRNAGNRVLKKSSKRKQNQSKANLRSWNLEILCSSMLLMSYLLLSEENSVCAPGRRGRKNKTHEETTSFLN